jgi:hypothetical protein
MAKIERTNNEVQTPAKTNRLAHFIQRNHVSIVDNWDNYHQINNLDTVHFVLGAVMAMIVW